MTRPARQPGAGLSFGNPARLLFASFHPCEGFPNYLFGYFEMEKKILILSFKLYHFMQQLFTFQLRH